MEHNTPADAHDAGMRAGWEVLKKATHLKLMMLARRSCAAEMPQLMLIMLGAGWGPGCGGC